MEVLHISDTNRRRSAAAVYWCRRFLLGIYPAMHDFLMDMKVLNERLSLASSLGEDKAVERETLADAILTSVQ